MMRGRSLIAILSRVERLENQMQLHACDQNHLRVRVSHTRGDDATPEWPPADAPERCICGRPLDYRHIVHHEHDDEPPGA